MTDFHFHSAHSRAQHAALNLPFTEHCHGEAVTTEPVETKRHLMLKTGLGILLVVLLFIGLSGLEQELAWRAAV